MVDVVVVVVGGAVVVADVVGGAVVIVLVVGGAVLLVDTVVILSPMGFVAGRPVVPWPS